MSKLPWKIPDMNHNSIFVRSVDYDWRENWRDGDPPYSVILPVADDLSWVDLEDWGFLPQNFDSLDEAILEFADSEAYYEWEDDFEPMMDFYWPVELKYGLDPQEAALLMCRLAGSTTLVEHGWGEYAIALTGGGMDLSWDIASAYLCCGAIPPEGILSGLPYFAGDDPPVPLYGEILEAIIKAAKFMEYRAANLERQRTDLIKQYGGTDE